MSGHKIIEGLKEATAGHFARVTIDGQTWVRVVMPDRPEAGETVRTITIIEDKAGIFFATSDTDPVMFCAAPTLARVFDAVLRTDTGSVT